MTDTTRAGNDGEGATDDRDRQLFRMFRLGLLVVTNLGALATFAATSLGPAILVLAAGGLLGAIALLWASLRSLFGDAPIDDALDEAAALSRTHRGTRAGERKRIALRALKDLEHEHSVGKIDDDDYMRLVARYRADAKVAIREMDEEVSVHREKAEELVRAHLEGRAKAKAKAARIPCPACKTKNDPDAAFCKKCGASMREEEEEEEGDEDEDGEEERDGGGDGDEGEEEER